jgi:hypothetical protein
LVAMAEDHMQRVLRRQKGETDRLVQGLTLAWEVRMAEEAAEEASHAVVDAKHSVARERSKAKAQRAKERLNDSLSRHSRSHQSLARERRRKQLERSVSQEASRMRVGESASEARSRRLQLQARAEQKRRQIAARNQEIQERQIEEGLAARSEYAAAMAAARVAAEERRSEQGDASRQRDAKIEERMQAFFRTEEAAADELAAQCREEDVRRSALTEVRRRNRAENLKAFVTEKDNKSRIARARVAAQVHERRFAVGSAKSSVELKAEAMAAVAARRAEMQGVQAAKSLIKRVRSEAHVTRMRRVDDFRRERGLEAFMHRQARASAAIDCQRRLREEQRSMTRDILIDRSVQMSELDRSLQKKHVHRPATAAAARSRLQSRQQRRSSGQDPGDSLGKQQPGQRPASAAP